MGQGGVNHHYYHYRPRALPLHNNSNTLMHVRPRASRSNRDAGARLRGAIPNISPTLPSQHRGAQCGWRSLTRLKLPWRRCGGQGLYIQDERTSCAVMLH